MIYPFNKDEESETWKTTFQTLKLSKPAGDGNPGPTTPVTPPRSAAFQRRKASISQHHTNDEGLC